MLPCPHSPPCRYKGYYFTGCGAHVGYKHDVYSGAGCERTWCYVSDGCLTEQVISLSSGTCDFVDARTFLSDPSPYVFSTEVLVRFCQEG